MAAGRLPMSVIRWEMTGLDDEVAEALEAGPATAGASRYYCRPAVIACDGGLQFEQDASSAYPRA